MTTPLGEGWATFHRLVDAARSARSPWRTMIVTRKSLRIVGHPYIAIKLKAIKACCGNDNEIRGEP